MKRLIMKSVAIATVVAVVGAFATSASAVRPDDLIHYWRMDEESGTTAVDSIGGADAIWQGTQGSDDPQPVAGLFGRAAFVNDENNGGADSQEHWLTGNLSGLETKSEFTLSMWFNQNGEVINNSTYNGLMMTRTTVATNNTGTNWGLAIRENGSPYRLDSRAHNAALDFARDSGFEFDHNSGWHHAVMVWNGTDVDETGMGLRSIWIDGQKANEGMTPLDTLVTGGQWTIGNDTCCGSRELSASLDDIAFWDVALDDAEVLQLYTDGTNGINAIGDLPPQPGDVDGDGDVDIDDYNILETNFGTAQSQRTDGDLDSDGLVGFSDLRQWKDSFPFAPGSGSAVPEPASLLLVCLSFFGLVGSRRRS